MIVRFGPFSIDREQYELRRDGEVIPCEPQILEVLSYLVEHRARVVGRDELIDAIWKRRFVSDSAVSRAIKEVRRLLGDTGAESRWIKTVYGRGFTFVGEALNIDRPEPEPAGATSPASGMAPLPVPLTPLVGRERELSEAGELLGKTRILTLTGAAGTGKSRLALELAERARDRFPDGLAFASLAEIRGTNLVPGAIALALGTTDGAGASAYESLQLHLRSSKLLLVLDNFEQVVGAAPDLARLLRAAPGVVALVTSRFVLRVEGEQEYPVPPLELPGNDAEASVIARAPTVELFVARARAVQPAFDPAEEDLGYVAEICRRLDGLPLAIELAAARIKMFSPRALWERLAARLDLLSSPYHHRGRTYPTLEQWPRWRGPDPGVIRKQGWQLALPLAAIGRHAAPTAKDVASSEHCSPCPEPQQSTSTPACELMQQRRSVCSHTCFASTSAPPPS